MPTVYSLSQFYNELNAGFEQLNQIRQLSETILLPNMDRPLEEFYDPATRRLRPKYGWYLSSMQNLQGQAATITRLGDQMVATLKREDSLEVR